MRNHAVKRIVSAFRGLLMLFGGASSLPAQAAEVQQTQLSRWLEADAAVALAAGARANGAAYVRIDSDTYDGIRADAAQTLSGLRLEYDTMKGKSVQTRLYIDKPALLQADTLGMLKGGSNKNCISTVNITVSGSGDSRAGGIAGHNVGGYRKLLCDRNDCNKRKWG